MPKKVTPKQRASRLAHRQRNPLRPEYSGGRAVKSADTDSVDWSLGQAFVAAQVITRTTEDLRFWVQMARQQGASWADVAAQIGTTRQAASQRFGGGGEEL